MSKAIDPDIKEKLQAQQERLNDKLSETTSAYWGAELTVNGIIIALFSFDILKSDDFLGILNFTVVSLAIVSVILILINFRLVRDMYFSLGKFDIDDFRQMDESGFEKSREKNIRAFKWRKRREVTVDILLALQLFIILFIISLRVFFSC